MMEFLLMMNGMEMKRWVLLCLILSGSDGIVVVVMEFMVVEDGSCGGGDGGDGVLWVR